MVLLRPRGAFQCPRVLCGFNIGVWVMGVGRPVALSMIEMVELCATSGHGVPSGLNVNVREWYEHFESSRVPPEHHRRSFQVCASYCMFSSMIL